MSNKESYSLLAFFLLSVFQTQAAQLACPTGYVAVPGDNDLNTEAFCVAKYEMKQGTSGVAVSQPAGVPWVNINATSAFTQCQAVSQDGFEGKFSLISNPEWMTIARNIENTAVNWSGGAIGSGVLSRGWSANASVDGFSNTGPAPHGEAGCEFNSGPNHCSSSGEHKLKRTHQLSNGEVIWDLSANVYEWTDWHKEDDEFSTGPKDCPNAGTELNTSFSCGLTAKDYKPQGNFNSAQNAGRLYADPGNGGAANRGFRWLDEKYAGIYGLNLTKDTGFSSGFVGFRCIYRPKTTGSNNQAPIAQADSFSLKSKDGTTELDILANDSDEDKASLIVTITNQSSLGGSATVSGQKLSYTPQRGYVGEYWVEYELTDKHGLKSQPVRATLSLLAVIPRTALVAEYLFENSNNLGLDSSGLGKHGINQGASSTAGFGKGKAAYFDGEQDFINMSALTPYIQYGKNFSLSMWVKREDAEYRGVFSGGSYQNTHNTQKFNIDSSDGWLRVDTQRNYGVARGRRASVTLENFTENREHHIVAVYQNDSLSFYVNGSLIGHQNMSGYDWSHIYPYALGARSNNGLTTFQSFKGVIDNVRLYSRALTSTDINNLAYEFGHQFEKITHVVNDDATTDINTSVEIDVLENDNHTEGGQLHIATSPLNGEAAIQGNKFIYTPNSDFYGEDEFSYKVVTNGKDSNVTKVSIEVFKQAQQPFFEPGVNYFNNDHVHYKRDANDKLFVTFNSPDSGVRFKHTKTTWNEQGNPIRESDIGYGGIVINERTRVSLRAYGTGYYESSAEIVDFHFIDHIKIWHLDAHGNKTTELAANSSISLKEARSGVAFRQVFELTDGIDQPNVSADKLPSWLSVGIDYNQPYKLVLSGVPQEKDVGPHKHIQIKVVDSFKSQKEFMAEVEVLPGNKKPIMGSVIAVNGPHYMMGDNVQVQAVATDPDAGSPSGGQISKMYFRLVKQGGQPQDWQVVSQVPWQFNFGQLTEGSYQVEVKAEDDLGGQSEVKVVNVEVKYLPGAIDFAWVKSEISVGQAATLKWQFKKGKVCRASSETQSVLNIGDMAGVNDSQASFTPYKSGEYKVSWLCEGETEAVEAVLNVSKLPAPTNLHR